MGNFFINKTFTLFGTFNHESSSKIDNFKVRCHNNQKLNRYLLFTGYKYLAVYKGKF